MNKYARFFAFGCSFTSWHWPTWADVIGHEFPAENYRNLGMCATGNEFAFHKLTQAHAKYNLTKDDLVVICWTNFAREDRYIKNEWFTPGNIFTQDMYPLEWVEKWFDLKGALLKTSSYIAAAKHILDSIGCKYIFTSMMPMTQIDEYDSLFAGDEFKDVFDLYKAYYNELKPSIVETLYGRGNYSNPEPATITWSSDMGFDWKDNHPTPLQHRQFVEKVLLPEIDLQLSENTVAWVNEWHQKVMAKPKFNCAEQGWSVQHRFKTHHIGLI